MKRRPSHAVLFVVVAAFLAACGGAWAADYLIAPTPAWIKPIPVDTAEAVPPTQISGGMAYLLLEHVVRIDADDRVAYRHNVEKALDDKGVDRIAHIEVEFDPSYQTLTLHALNQIRDGRITSKLSTGRIKVLQRERELESRIYDGTKTATVFLEDVRPGDSVELAYSLRGRNPVFKGREYGRSYLQWRAPVRHLHERLLVPAGRSVVFGQYNTKIQPTVSESAGLREYVWDLHDIAALHTESSTPGWFDPYPRLEWSEFPDWSSVARWAEPLYQTPKTLPAALQLEVDRIARASSDAQSRLLATLSFVQTQIRYMGVEVGPGSHAPNPPQLVLQRRYGDCKDKALLTVTLLRALGIDAWVALVDTEAGRALQDILAPSPGAFNHVIVRASVDGRDYWIDPTRSPQKGSLARLSQADYGYALLLDGRSSALTKMPAPSSELSRRQIRMHFDARLGGYEPVPLTVTTVYEGADADWNRDRLTPDKLEQAQRNYLNYYARSYPGISVRAPLAIMDDETANRLTVTENYLVAGLWSALVDPEQTNAKSYLYAPDMRREMAAPNETKRHTPLAVQHPDDLTVSIEADLPGEWSIQDGSWTVEDPAFRFTKRVSHIDAQLSTLTVTHRYQSRSDHVALADVAGHVAHLAQARDMVGYTLKKADMRNTTTQRDWGGLVFAALVLLISRRPLLRLVRFMRAWIARPKPIAATASPASAGEGA